MSWKIVSLLDAIEDLRNFLNRFASSKSLIDQDVVRVSQRLDYLLNEYNQALSIAYGLAGK